jgi:outer membrane lipopolysaccharide assembly protein LptE/RlpB
VGNNNQILATSVWRLATAFLLATCCLLLVACGYHEVGGKSVQLPADVHTVAVPAFENRSTVYHLEQVLTEAVVREFLARTQYRVIAREDPEADAVLHGTILNVIISPLTYDSQTGRASTALITIVMGVKLTGRQGKVLFENPNYIFREQYQLSQDPATFFQEETPAFRRMAQNFSNGLVSNILEAY